MLAYFTPNAVLARHAKCETTARYFVELLDPDNDTLVQQHIASFANPGSYGYDANKHAYAEMLSAGPCYRIVYVERVQDRDKCNMRFPIPASLVNIVDETAVGTRMRITSPSIDYHYLRNPLDLGQEIYCVPANRQYDGDGVFVIEGPGYLKVGLVPNSCISPWTDTWENPWQEVPAKIIARSGHGVSTHAINYVVPLAKNQTTGQLLLTQGNYTGQPVDAYCVVFAANEKEAEVFARKAHRSYQLQASLDVHTLIDDLEDGYGYYLNAMSDEEQWSSFDVFIWGLNPGNYVAIDPADHTRVTYLPQSKVAGVLAKGLDPWDNPSRQSTTWGKFAKLMLNDKQFNDESRFESFSTQMVANATELFGPEESKPELVVVNGDDIATYYDGDKYVKGGGSLNGSCMRGCEATRFELYTKNPDQVSLLICRDRQTALIHGRCLLWHHPDGSKYVDRRYGTTLQVEARMLNWAEKQGYINIWGGHYSPKAGVQIQLTEWLFARYPYMDSMARLDPRTGILSSVSISGVRTSEVKSTSGHRTKAGLEEHCAKSKILVPVELLEKTASGDYAMPKYVKTLRSGKKELEARCVEDQLEGGLIARAEMIKVFVNADPKDHQLKVTSKGSPLVAITCVSGIPTLKEYVVLSPLDGGYILKHEAVQQPDGGWCLPQTVARYQAWMSRKKVNKARRVPMPAAVAQLAELAVAA
jgi:hypothetical protein